MRDNNYNSFNAFTSRATIQTQRVQNRNSIKQQTPNSIFTRYERSMHRKIVRQKSRIGGFNIGSSSTDKLQNHQYDYKEFGEQPNIQYSGISLLLVSPILLRINLSIAEDQGIPIVQFLFVTSFVSFVFNLIFVIRKNQLMPFLPKPHEDNKLKLAAIILVMAMYSSLLYGWSASGGIIFAIVWQSFAGHQGCLYLIIFAGVISGSVAMEMTSPEDFALKLCSSIFFGIAESLLHSLAKNSVYAITNQITLFTMLGTVLLYPFAQIRYISLWQYLILLLVGMSVYFNLLLMIRLMQTERVSMVTGVMSGIIIISATQITQVSDLFGSLTIILSILALLKMEYVDKEKLQ